MAADRDPLRVAIVPGVTVTKWTRAWSERRPDTALEVMPVAEPQQRSVLFTPLTVDSEETGGGPDADGPTAEKSHTADISFVRLPVDQSDLSVIRLYREQPVVLVPRDHPIALFESITLGDLSGETLRTEPLRDAIELVAAGVGIVVLPQSIARQHARKDVVARPITDAPPTEIAVAWVAEHTTIDIEQFVGIVRGRTAASSRGTGAADAAPEASAAAPDRKKRAARTTPTTSKKVGRTAARSSKHGRRSGR